jgi:citrate lyase beta subunit
MTVRKQAADTQVCVNYKDENAVRAESEEGRRLGFDGKVSRDFFLISTKLDQS